MILTLQPSRPSKERAWQGCQETNHSLSLAAARHCTQATPPLYPSHPHSTASSKCPSHKPSEEESLMLSSCVQSGSDAGGSRTVRRGSARHRHSRPFGLLSRASVSARKKCNTVAAHGYKSQLGRGLNPLSPASREALIYHKRLLYRRLELEPNVHLRSLLHNRLRPLLYLLLHLLS